MAKHTSILQHSQNHPSKVISRLDCLFKNLKSESNYKLWRRNLISICFHQSRLFALAILTVVACTMITLPTSNGLGQVNSQQNSVIETLKQSVFFKNGEMHITGQIKNTGNQSLSSVKALASFYEKSGKFVGSEFTITEPDLVIPNNVSNFDINIRPNDPKVQSTNIYTITIAWENPDGSSSYSVLTPPKQRTEAISKEPSSTSSSKSIDSNSTVKRGHPSTLNIKYLGTIGSKGSTFGKFLNPGSVEFSPFDNRVYVSDMHNKRIQIFDTNGLFNSSWSDISGGKGDFNHPGDIGVDSITGYVYVSDIDSNTIQKFDASGKFVAKWGSTGVGDGQFNQAGDITVDTAKRFVYVTDVHNNRVQKFDTNGNFITKWGSAGAGDGQFRFPTGITIDGDGMIYVADTFNDRIQKFDTNGNFITTWDSTGTVGGAFSRPDGITYDLDSDLLYVSDRKNKRIQVLTEDGHLFYNLDLAKATNDLNIKPRDVTIDRAGKLFVVDKDNNKIHVFNTR
jgi:DNA-binding beta-propeller fold protein YncE